MLVACWSVKGGSGTSVVAASLALLLSERNEGAVLADLDGDLPAVLGLPSPSGPGIRHWLDAGDDVPVDGLRRLAVRVHRGLRLLPWCGADGEADGAPLIDGLSSAFDPANVVVDCGTIRGTHTVGLSVAAAAPLSLLVLRPCYLALRRALDAPVRPTAVVLVVEPERSLSGADVEDVLGVPVQAKVAWDPSIARAVDSGLLVCSMPRKLGRALRRTAA
jgi:Mrp family chromosome partitioning ATPase